MFQLVLVFVGEVLTEGVTKCHLLCGVGQVFALAYVQVHRHQHAIEVPIISLLQLDPPLQQQPLLLLQLLSLLPLLLLPLVFPICGLLLLLFKEQLLLFPELLLLELVQLLLEDGVEVYGFYYWGGLLLHLVKEDFG